MNKERTILYLFSINAIIYIASGFYTPFLSAYYAQKGIDAEKIGILLMIGPCVVLLTQRFWAKISDRTGKRKEVLLVTIVGSGFSMLLYYLGNSFLCMFFATVVVTSFTTAVIPLSDAILIARSLKEGYSYSIIRLGGTLGYAVMTICAGMYLKTRPQMQFVFGPCLPDREPCPWFKRYPGRLEKRKGPWWRNGSGLGRTSAGSDLIYVR